MLHNPRLPPAFNTQLNIPNLIRDVPAKFFPKMLFYAFLAQLLLALCSSSILMLCCGCCKRNKSKNQRVTRTRVSCDCPLLVHQNHHFILKGRPIVTNRPPNKIPATTRDKNNKPADSDGTKKDADATSQKTQKKSTRTTKTAQISLKDVVSSLTEIFMTPFLPFCRT